MPIVKLRCTDDESVKWHAMASVAGVSLSELIRARLDERPVGSRKKVRTACRSARKEASPESVKAIAGPVYGVRCARCQRTGRNEPCKTCEALNDSLGGLPGRGIAGDSNAVSGGAGQSGGGRSLPGIGAVPDRNSEPVHGQEPGVLAPADSPGDGIRREEESGGLGASEGAGPGPVDDCPY